MPHESIASAPMQRALVDCIRRPAAGAEMQTNLPGFFRQHGAEAADVEASSKHGLASRFQLYRALVLGRLKGALEVSIPRTLAWLGRENVDSDLDAFLLARGPRSAYLRDVAAEFVAFAQMRWQADAAMPAFLSDLAKHELSFFEIAAAEDDAPIAPMGQVTVDTTLRFQRAARLLHYDYAVHRLPDELGDRTVPEPGAFALLAYRDASRQVRDLELSGLDSALLTRAMNGEPLGSATIHACADVAIAPNDETLASIAQLLDDLEHRGVLVGTL